MERLAKCEAGETIRSRCRKCCSFAMPLTAVSAVGKWSDRDDVLQSSRRCFMPELSSMRLKAVVVQKDACSLRHTTCVSAVRFDQSRHDVGRSV
jgi:hypothetical protein